MIGAAIREWSMSVTLGISELIIALMFLLLAIVTLTGSKVSGRD